VGLIAAVIIGYQYWHAVSIPEPNETAMQQPVKAAVAPVKLDAFIIPYQSNNFSYIALDVFIKVPAGPLRNEMISKLGLIRGRIYEKLNGYIQEIEDVPAPDKIKTIISNVVTTSLSKGEIGELYLTQFLVI
jgi:flagellar basal body-associated protein FliL